MNEVEQTEVEETTEQESPTVEENEPEAKAQDASKDDAEKNWKALREENERLKSQLSTKPVVEEEVPSPMQTKKDSDMKLFVSDADRVKLEILEDRAEEEVPELSTDSVLAKAAQGAYLTALASYNHAVMMGKEATLPNPVKIAKSVKKEFDERFGAVSKKAEVEGAKKAQKAKEDKVSTTEVEGRSDRAKGIQSSDELETLRNKSRKGDVASLAERLARNKL